MKKEIKTAKAAKAARSEAKSDAMVKRHANAGHSSVRKAKGHKVKVKDDPCGGPDVNPHDTPVMPEVLPTPSLKFATVHEGPARLRKGDVINLFRQHHMVVMVNQSRALCVPMSRRAVSHEMLHGQKVEFTKAENGTAISPNAEVDIIERGGQAALDAFLSPKAQEPKEKKARMKKERKPRGESKCAFIDSLLEKGGHTFTQIAKLAADKFESNLQSTMATVRARPAHMRNAGKTPKWIKE